MKSLMVLIALTTLASATLGAAFKEVSFATSDGGQIFANLYGKGSHAGQGAEKVSLLGGSVGGRASAEASVVSEPGDIHRLVLLANPPFGSPQKLKGDKLFIVSEGDRLAASVKKEFQKAPKPKRLEVLQGDAHAQHIFKTDQAGKLEKLIVGFLTEE